MGKKILGLFVCVSFFGTQARAAMTPVSIGIFPPLQFPSEDVTVVGLRANILWGFHRNVYGFDLGLGINQTSQTITGLAQIAGIANLNKGQNTILGAQIGGIANFNTNPTRVIGVQFAGITNNNQGDSMFVGLQISPVNLSSNSRVVGAQIGLFNTARKVVGFQIGLVNRAESVTGLQIGLMNFHRLGLFAACPIINFGF
jgi:hypothetical protein